MAIAARFFVDTITRHGRFDGITVVLAPVTGGRSSGPDNSDWSKFTPSGELRMTVTNPAAIAQFEELLGKDVAITIEARPDDE